MKVAYIIPIIKKVAKKFRNVYTFFIFALPLKLTEFLKTYIMKKDFIKNDSCKLVLPNPVEQQCKAIQSIVQVAKVTFENHVVNPDVIDLSAHQNYIKSLDVAIKRCDTLRSYLVILRDCVEDDIPLPF